MKPLIAHLGNVWNVYGPMACGSGETIRAAWQDYTLKTMQAKTVIVGRQAAIQAASRYAMIRRLFESAFLRALR
jgi:hypothetical protein